MFFIMDVDIDFPPGFAAQVAAAIVPGETMFAPIGAWPTACRAAGPARIPASLTMLVQPTSAAFSQCTTTTLMPPVACTQTARRAGRPWVLDWWARTRTVVAVVVR